MAYRCPVCDSPQTDAEHLANHLAFTAVIRGNGHEIWLDEHVPDWGDRNPETLAPAVTEVVPNVDVPELDDDGHDHAHDHPGGGGRLEDELAKQGGHRGPGASAGASSSAGGRGDLATDAEDVLEEARELTEQMYGLDDTEPEDGTVDSEADGADDGEEDDTADSEVDVADDEDAA
jgi:hypothetical protein